MSPKYSLKDLKKEPKKNLLNGSENQANKKQKTKQSVSIKKEPLKRGRKPKTAEDRLTQKVTVNFTVAEMEALKELSAQNFNIPLPTLIRGILKEQEII